MKLAIFLFISAVMLLLSGLYFEYMINRDCPLLLSGIVGLVLIVALIYYIKYAVKTIQTFLEL